MHAQEQWLIDQIKDQVPDGVYLQALMDQEVNEMDPDFSFRKWYGENHWLLEDQPVPEYYKWGMHLTPEAPRSSIRALEDHSRTLGEFQERFAFRFQIQPLPSPRGAQ